MIDTDEYIKMWNDNLLGSEGVNDLMNALIAEVQRLRKKLFEAELWVNNDSYTFENDMKELNDYAEAMEE